MSKIEINPSIRSVINDLNNKIDIVVVTSRGSSRETTYYVQSADKHNNSCRFRIDRDECKVYEDLIKNRNPKKKKKK